MSSGPRGGTRSRPKGRAAERARPRSRASIRGLTAGDVAGRRAASSTVRALSVGSVLLLLAILLVPTLTSYLDQRGEIAALERQVAAQKTDVAAMEREKSLWASDEYVEQQARERLKFVKVGEKAYSIIDEDPDDTSATLADAASRPGAALPWYGQLWEATKVADNPQRVTTG